MSDLELPQAVERIRAFNRFYTQTLKLLDDGFLASPYTLAEIRILWELAHRDRPTAADLARDLDMDPGQISRMLKPFAAAGLILREADDADQRRVAIILTETGRAALAPLEDEQRRRVAAGLDRLDADALDRLVAAMADIRRLLSRTRSDLTLRPHRPGDLAYVVHRQATYYARAHGFDERFEALIAEVAATFLRDFDPRHEASFLAEVDGRIVGSVFVTRHDERTAKLRLLHVETELRGSGIGARLVEEVIRFARARGYATLTLWTRDVLLPARRLYQRLGFRCVDSQPHRMFGPAMNGETWELDLAPSGTSALAERENAQTR